MSQYDNKHSVKPSTNTTLNTTAGVETHFKDDLEEISPVTMDIINYMKSRVDKFQTSDTYLPKKSVTPSSEGVGAALKAASTIPNDSKIELSTSNEQKVTYRFTENAAELGSKLKENISFRFTEDSKLIEGIPKLFPLNDPTLKIQLMSTITGVSENLLKEQPLNIQKVFFFYVSEPNEKKMIKALVTAKVKYTHTDGKIQDLEVFLSLTRHLNGDTTKTQIKAVMCEKAEYLLTDIDINSKIGQAYKKFQSVLQD